MTDTSAAVHAALVYAVPFIAWKWGGITGAEALVVHALMDIEFQFTRFCCMVKAIAEHHQ